MNKIVTCFFNNGNVETIFTSKEDVIKTCKDNFDIFGIDPYNQNFDDVVGLLTMYLFEDCCDTIIIFNNYTDSVIKIVGNCITKILGDSITKIGGVSNVQR